MRAPTVSMSGEVDAVMEMQVRQMQMDAAGQQRDEAEAEAHDETDEIEIGPIHDCLRLGCAAGAFRTSMSRSANPGFSRISPRRTRHIRESACFAMVSRDSWSSGSL